MKRLFLTQMANIMSCGMHRHSIIRSKDLRMYEKFSYILFFYETFIHILLSNICKMKKEEKRLSYIHCARGEKYYEKTNR